MTLLWAPESTQNSGVKLFHVDGRMLDISLLEQSVNEGSCNVFFEEREPDGV